MSEHFSFLISCSVNGIHVCRVVLMMFSIRCVLKVGVVGYDVIAESHDLMSR